MSIAKPKNQIYKLKNFGVKGGRKDRIEIFTFAPLFLYTSKNFIPIVAFLINFLSPLFLQSLPNKVNTLMIIEQPGMSLP